jgi:acyl carrier protein
MDKKFLNNFEDCLEIDNNSLSLDTAFKELPEWDSLGLLNFMAMLEDEYGIQISRKQLDELVTLKDVYNLTI